MVYVCNIGKYISIFYLHTGFCYYAGTCCWARALISEHLVLKQYTQTRDDKIKCNYNCDTPLLSVENVFQKTYIDVCAMFWYNSNFDIFMYLFHLIGESNCNQLDSTQVYLLMPMWNVQVTKVVILHIFYL